MARNLRLIESLWRYGIGGTLARFECNLTRSVYLTLWRMRTNVPAKVLSFRGDVQHREPSPCDGRAPGSAAQATLTNRERMRFPDGPRCSIVASLSSHLRPFAERAVVRFSLMQSSSLGPPCYFVAAARASSCGERVSVSCMRHNSALEPTAASGLRSLAVPSSLRSSASAQRGR